MLRALIASMLLIPALVACGASGDDDASSPAATMTPAASPVAEAPAADPSPPAAPSEPVMQIYKVPAGSRPHDVAPAVDGGVWYTAQGSGELGWLDPRSGEVREIPLGAGSAPH